MASGAKRAAILGLDDRRKTVVEVPEWDVRIQVRSLTARARAEFIRMAGSVKGDRAAQQEQVLPWVIVECCYDEETGEQLFTHEDHAALLDRHPDVLDRLSAAALIVSGLGETAREEAGKDSAPTPTGASSSGSPLPSDEPSGSSRPSSTPPSSPSGRSSRSSSRSGRGGKSTEPARSSPQS